MVLGALEGGAPPGGSILLPLGAQSRGNPSSDVVQAAPQWGEEEAEAS